MIKDKDHVELEEQLWVNADDKFETEYIHSQFPWFTHEQIAEAIKTAGPRRKDIEAYLSEKNGKK